MVLSLLVLGILLFNEYIINIKEALGYRNIKLAFAKCVKDS